MISRCTVWFSLFFVLVGGMVYDTAIASNKHVYDQPLTLGDYIGKHCKKDCVSEAEILPVILKTARKYTLDAKLILAIIRVESSFKRKAKSGSNVGLMQVNIKWHKKKFRNVNYYDPILNVDVGTGIYKDCLLLHKENRSRSLNCYNGSRLNDVKYVNKVMAAYREIKKLINIDESDLDEGSNSFHMEKMKHENSALLLRWNWTEYWS